MVRKLLKHEAKYYVRTLLIYEIVLFTLAIFTRIFMFFETDSVIYYILQGSSFLLFILAVYGCSLMATVVSVFRFYKNLYTSEGYLSFALPVTTNQHLFAKLFSAMLYNIIVMISSIAAFCVTISGDIFNEVVKAAIYIFKKLIEVDKLTEIPVNLHLSLFLLEFLAILFVSLIFNQLLFYTCITIGQTANKHRILLAVAVYFGYMMLTEIFSTFISMFFSIALNLEFFEKFLIFYGKHPIATIHIFMCASLVFSIILTVACYVITNVIMKRKLNLE